MVAPIKDCAPESLIHLVSRQEQSHTSVKLDGVRPDPGFRTVFTFTSHDAVDPAL